MRHAHALAILILALLVAGAGLCSPSIAQTALRARARPQAPPVVELPAAPAVTATTAAPHSAPARLTLRGLPQSFDAAPACRARCTASRAACEAVEEACAPQWSACLHRCTAA